MGLGIISQLQIEKSGFFFFWDLVKKKTFKKERKKRKKKKKQKRKLTLNSRGDIFKQAEKTTPRFGPVILFISDFFSMSTKWFISHDKTVLFSLGRCWRRYWIEVILSESSDSVTIGKKEREKKMKLKEKEKSLKKDEIKFLCLIKLPGIFSNSRSRFCVKIDSGSSLKYNFNNPATEKGSPTNGLKSTGVPNN